jgi:hypothetical protein
VGSIAERLALGVAAAAKGDGAAAGKAEGSSCRVQHLEIAFDEDWAVIANRDLCACHEVSLELRLTRRGR